MDLSDSHRPLVCRLGRPPSIGQSSLTFHMVVPSEGRGKGGGGEGRRRLRHSLFSHPFSLHFRSPGALGPRTPFLWYIVYSSRSLVLVPAFAVPLFSYTRLLRLVVLSQARRDPSPRGSEGLLFSLLTPKEYFPSGNFFPF